MATREANDLSGPTVKLHAPRAQNRGWDAQRVLASTWQLLSNRWLMAGVVLVGTLIYVWNATRVIDYPVYDESFYFFRGWSLYHGNLAQADLFDPNSSPLYIVYYAICFALLHIVDLYPIVLPSCMVVLGLGAYALLMRFFHPALAAIAALVVVTWSAPFAPQGLYIFATGCLWLCLAVIGPKIWQRALGLTLVFLAVLLRPDFLQVAVVLAVLLFGYEVWQWRHSHSRPEWRVLATMYAPVVLTGAVLLYLFLSVSGATGGRSSFAIPWSYSEYYSVVDPSQFNSQYDLTDVWRLFEKDFGQVPEPRSTTQTMLAMSHNPPAALAYIRFESERLVASFGTAAFQGRSWQAQAQQTQIPINITAQDTTGFAAMVLLYFVVVLGCYVWLRSRGIVVMPSLKRNVPGLLGYISLAGLLPLLILINPYQRFYMLYPLLLLPVGWGLMCLWRVGEVISSRHAHAATFVSYGVVPAALLLVLVAMPQPYAHAHSVQLTARTLAFLRENVPSGATVIGEPADSFANFLIAGGDNVQGIQASQYPYSVIVNVLKADPSLQNVEVLFNSTFPYSSQSQWITGWQQTYPQLPLTVVATDPKDNLTLVQLPPYVGERIAYLQFAQMSTTVGYTGLPSYAQMSFGPSVRWHSSDPQNNVQTKYWQAWGLDLPTLVMHPGGPGVDPTAPHDVTLQLPPQWSGKELIFAATLAPWAADQPQAQGVRFTLSLPDLGVSQTTEILNTYPHQGWVPIVLHLPTYSGTQTLDVRVDQRVSIVDDTSFLSFYGAATPDASSAPGSRTSTGSNG